MPKKTITVILFIALAWNFTVSYVDKQLEKESNSAVYANCHKVWAARGLYENHSEQNTIVSMQRAFTAGALGVEVDFYYDIKMDRFIISHNRPTKGNDGNLIYTKKNGKLLTLEKLMQTVGAGHYFWFDYKNLDKLNIQETKDAISRLLSISEKSTMRERIYIEGSNPLRLSMYTDAGFKTILGIHPLRENNLFSSIVLNGFKIAYYFTNITGLALPYGAIGNPVYGKKTAKSLRTIPIFLFHVPDNKDLLYSLIDRDDVRVLLVGRDASINRFNINTCK